MRNVFFILMAVMLVGCGSFMGKQDYIAIGPQNLSVQVKKAEDLPIFVSREDITKPWASIGLLRVKNLPNDRNVIKRELSNMKKFAMKKGANAIVTAQYFDEDANAQYPITLAAYLVKYLDGVSEADKQKIDEFAALAELENNAGM